MKKNRPAPNNKKRVIPFYLMDNQSLLFCRDLLLAHDSIYLEDCLLEIRIRVASNSWQDEPLPHLIEYTDFGLKLLHLFPFLRFFL